MRTVWMIPVAYVAGIEGFGWFVPYLLLVCAIATLARMRAARRRVSPARNDPQLGPQNGAMEQALELEATPA